MSKRDLVRENRDAILALATRHGAKNIRLAGSVARGEDRPDSDVDFLVEMENGRSLLDRAKLIVDLGDLLACEVDVVNERGAKPRVRESLLRDAAVL